VDGSTIVLVVDKGAYRGVSEVQTANILNFNVGSEVSVLCCCCSQVLRKESTTSFLDDMLACHQLSLVGMLVAAVQSFQCLSARVPSLLSDYCRHNPIPYLSRSTSFVHVTHKKKRRSNSPFPPFSFRESATSSEENSL
jgi:hypothetical protein